MTARDRLKKPSGVAPKKRTSSQPESLTKISFEREDRSVSRIEGRRNYIVTSAQNNTPVELGFWKAIQQFAEHRTAEIVVIPIRYRNPTSRSDPRETARRAKKDTGYWWPDEVLKHLVENELQVHEYLRVMAHVRIQATELNPLVGLDEMSQSASAIYGHGQLSMKTVATPHQILPKLLYTTGSISKRNYSSTKRAARAAFHHVNAAIVVETRGDRFHAREVTWDGKAFYDLDEKFMPSGVELAEPALALITGDEHAIWYSDDVGHATYTGARSIVKMLRPKLIIRHDVLDGYSVCPHHQHNAHAASVKARTRYGDLEWELGETIRHINETTPKGSSNVIVPSNHHNFLMRWLRSPAGAIDARNAPLYHELNSAVLKEARIGPGGPCYPDPFEVYCRGKLTVPARFLEQDDSCVVKKGSHLIEVGMHGHLGPDGRQGSAVQFSRIGPRTIVGHSHSPKIEKGCYQVGTSSVLRLEYNAGPSSWLNTHAVIHPNGRRQMIHVIKRNWRG